MLCCFVSFVSSSNLGYIQQLINFGQIWQAIEETNKLIDGMNERSTEIYLTRASCYYRVMRPNETIHDCNKALEYAVKDDDIKAGYNLRYAAYIQIGDPAKAEADAKKLKDKEKIKNAQNLKSLISKSTKYLKSSNKNDLKSLLDEVLSTSPRYMPALHKRIEMAWEDGDSAKYEDLAEYLAQMLSEDGNIHCNLGIAMFCNGRMGDGRAYLQQHRRLPNSPSNASKIFTQMASLKRDIESANSALTAENATELFTVLRRLNSTLPKLCSRENSPVGQRLPVMSAVLHAIEGQKERALDELTAIIDRSPGSAFAWQQRGKLRLQTGGDLESALYDLKNAQQLAPGDGETARLLRAAEERRRKESVEYLYRILEVESDASEEEVKKSYKRLVRKWHPDQFADPEKKEDAEKMMRAINAAYELIMDPNRKEQLEGGEGEDPFEFMRKKMGGDPFEFFGQHGFQFMFHF